MDYLPFELIAQKEKLEELYGIKEIRDGSLVSFIADDSYNHPNSPHKLFNLLDTLRRQCPNNMYKCVHCYIAGYFWGSKRDFVVSDRILDLANKQRVSIWSIKTHLAHIFQDIGGPLEWQFSLFDFRITMKQTSSKPRKSRRPISGVTRQNVFMRDNYTCQICGRTIKDGVSLVIDHIIPISMGGSNDEINLQCLCSQCNSEKNNRTDLKHDENKLKELEAKYGN